MPALAPKGLKLLDFLKLGALEGPVKIQLNDAPLLVIDPGSQTYLGSNSLKPYTAYGMASLTEANFIAIDNDEWSINNAKENYSFIQPAIATNTLFREITDSLNVHYTHQEIDFIDFKKRHF